VVAFGVVVGNWQQKSVPHPSEEVQPNVAAFALFT
jgi:hypothetical protein